MAIYTPKYDYRVKDSLPSGNTAKVIRGTELMEEFENISSDLISLDQRVTTNSAIIASCKFNGEAVRYAFNVKEVIQPQEGNNGFERVVFENEINMDEPIQLPDGSYANPGDFAAVFTGYTTSNTMSIFSVTDQRESYIDVAIRTLGGNGTWETPSQRIGFAMILVDQVPG